MNRNGFNLILEDTIKNTLYGEKLVKEILLMGEIDREKSDVYFIDEQHGTLHFLYHSCDKVNYGDLIPIFGEMVEDGGNVLMYPVIEKSIGDTVKRSHALVAKPIKNDTDIVEISFCHDSKGIFYYHFINEYNSRIRKKFAAGELKYTSENLSDSLNEYIISTFNEKSLNITHYAGLDLCDGNSLHGLRCGSKLRYVVNLRSNCSYVIQDNMKKVFFDYKFRDAAERYVLLGYNHKPEDMEETGLNITGISYGSQYGYIYLKPFINTQSQIKIKMIFSGTPQVQYYCTNEHDWKSIIDGELLNCKADMDFRVKMKCGDSIYRLYVLEA